jgi:hypothetical protein
MNPVELTRYNSDNIFIYFEKYEENLEMYIPVIFNMTWKVVEFTEFSMSI